MFTFSPIFIYRAELCIWNSSVFTICLSLFKDNRLFLQQIQFNIINKKYLRFLFFFFSSFFFFLMKLYQRIVVIINSYFTTIARSCKIVNITLQAEDLWVRTFYLILTRVCSLQHQSKLHKRSSDVTTRGMKVSAYYGLRTPPYELVSHQPHNVLILQLKFHVLGVVSCRYLLLAHRVHLMVPDI